ncbi:MAG: hypothetical protein ACI4RM_00425 [Ruminococcus sp.]
MSYYLENKKPKEYVMPPTIIEANYNPGNGYSYNVGNPTPGKYVGYYTEDNMPQKTNEYVANYNSYGGQGYSYATEGTGSSEDASGETTETGGSEEVPSETAASVAESSAVETTAAPPATE